MYLPPLVVDVYVHENTGKRHHIWVPLFLLWPLFLILLVPVVVVSLIVDAVLWLSGAKYYHYTALIFGALSLLAEARGTSVHTNAQDESVVDIEIY
jgi:hypothetical protein